MNRYTEKLEDFGHIELDTAKDLFTAWKYNGLPKDFEDDGVKVAFNSNSGESSKCWMKIGNSVFCSVLVKLTNSF